MKGDFAELGSIAEFINGAAFKPEDWGDEGKPIIRIQNLNDSTKPFNRTKRVVSEKLHVRPGDLLVSWSASLGVFEWSEPEIALLNQHIFRVLPDETRIEKRYLRHGLERAMLEMQKHLHGATMQHINRGEFLATKLYLPPLAEQRRLAEILDTADALRAKRRAAVAKVDILTQSVFLDMFGDPASNPKGWPVFFVEDVADVQGGLQVMSARSKLPLEVPYLRVANVYRRFLDLREIKMIRTTEAEFARTKLVRDDLLIVEGHGNPAEIGRSALWDGSIANCVHQNHLIRARFAPTKVLAHYACEYLNSAGGRRHLLQAGKTTSGLNTISVSEVRKTPIALPPVGLQRQFAGRLDAINRLRTTQRASLVELGGFFSALQTRAFRGEL